MSTCVNGWAGIPDESDSRLVWITVPGTRKRVLLRREAAPVFACILAEINKLLIPLDPGPLDGWEYRETRSGQGLSCHAGGVAVDFRYDVLLADNELHWPASKHAIMHKLLDKYVTSTGKRIFGWGGDWTPGKYADEMHLELVQSWGVGAQGEDCTLADVQNVIKRLRIKPDGTRSIISIVLPVPAPKPNPAPAPTGKGPDWWLQFLRAHKVANERALFAIGMRESNGDPLCIYPAGSPKDGDWSRSTAPWYDCGVTQVNLRHKADLAKYGYGSDMRCMLDPEKNLDYALKHLAWSDWGLKIAADGSSYSFDWTGWPSPYRPGESGAVSAEAGFKEWWDKYPTYAAKLTGMPPKVPPTPTPTPNPLQKPSVSLSGVQRGLWKDVRVVQIALNRVMNAHLVIDGKWGPATQAAFDTFRRNTLGMSGAAATGLPGKQSLTALGNRAGFIITA